MLFQHFYLQQPTLVHAPAIPPLVVSSGASDNMCQALLDVVAAHMKSPTLNHTLQRTFGPAVRALHGPSIRLVSKNFAAAPLLMLQAYCYCV